MRIFRDRQAAGELLAKRLEDKGYRGYKGDKGIVVLGIPRGGVVVAREVADRLNLPLDIIITRKIGAPMQKELALGAVDPSGEVVWDEQLIGDLRLRIKDLREEVKKQAEEIKRREVLYRSGRKPLDVKYKIVILVDDGIATGATILAAINYLKKLGAQKIIVVAPVGAKDSIDTISSEADEVVVLYVPASLGAVGSFYQNFEAISDQEVLQLLK